MESCQSEDWGRRRRRRNDDDDDDTITSQLRWTVDLLMLDIN